MIKRSMVFCLLLCSCAAYAHGTPTYALSAVVKEIAKEAFKAVGTEACKTGVECFKSLFNRNKDIAKNNKNPQLQGGGVKGNKRIWNMAPVGNLSTPELKEIAKILKSIDQNREQVITITRSVTAGNIARDNASITQDKSISGFNNINAGGDVNINISSNESLSLAGQAAMANGTKAPGILIKKDECPSPYEYITKVYSAGDKAIEYELAPNFDYERIDVIFFGERDVVQRTNTPIRLKATKGIFEIPKRALLKPVQRGFNFIITDNKNCERWGQVDETALQAEGKKGNKIRIDRTNPSEKKTAFVIDELLKE